MSETDFSSPTQSPLARFRQNPLLAADRGPDPDSLLGDARGLAWSVDLTEELERRAPIITELRQYRAGVQPIKFSTEAWQETYGKDFGVITDNWCEVVVEAIVEKQVVLGFRFGEDGTDDEAWEAWQGNRMDLDSETVHDDACTTGYGYAMVWPGLDGAPEITHEDPLHTIVVTDPANRRRRIAGMKRWLRRDGLWEAIVYTPDTWWRVEQAKTGGNWQLIKDRINQPATGPNDINVVPIVEFANAPDENGRGTSILVPVLPLQDAINKLTADEMIVSEHAGYPQRVLLGFETPQADESDEDEDGEPTVKEPEFRGGKNRWMGFEGEKSRIQELTTADLTVFGKSISQKVEHISSKTRTPAYLFPGGLINISAETLRAADAGHVARVKRANHRRGEGWEEVMRLFFKLAGKPDKAAMLSAETVWADPETIAEAQRVDALVKLKQSLGLPLEYLLERWGLTPQEVERVMDMVARDETRMAELDGVAAGISGPSGLPPEPTPV